MGKTVEDICNLISKNVDLTIDFSTKTIDVKNLSSSIEYLDSSDILNGFDNIYFAQKSDLKVRQIAKELAFAIDRNSVTKIKELKNKYGKLKEFDKAKKLLEGKCKEIWNVYNPIKNIPLDAMKTLGITNQPELSFLLDNSVKFYEKDESDTTSYIISSILKNKNINYTIEDIHKYLVHMHLKEKCSYNTKTVQYLIKEQNYDRKKLSELGINNEIITQSLKNLPIKTRIKFMLK